MASLKGPFHFTGSIGNIKSIYNRKLKRYILSTKGGPSAELIKNSPAFARTRENMQEFKACGKFSSQLRKSLLLLSHLFDAFYFSEIVRMAKEIQINDDQHLRGFRSIEASKYPAWLSRLNFNRKQPFQELFWGNVEVTIQDDRQTVILKLTDFVSYRHIRWPSRFSSCRVSLLIARLSDWVCDPATGDYLPVIPDLEQCSVITRSLWLPRSLEPVDLVLSAAFKEPAPDQPGTTIIAAMGIEISSIFLQPDDGSGSTTGTMRILECWAKASE